MLERRPSIGFGVDDVNSPRALDYMDALRYPFQAAVIVTNDPNFMDIGDFARRYGWRVRRYAPVLHSSLFTGDFSHDDRHLLGPDGKLHNLLHITEYTPLEERPRHFKRDMNERFRRILDKNERYIIDEHHRQLDRFEALFGIRAVGINHHYGLHEAPPLIDLYVRAARERGLPYRYDASRAGTNRKHHVPVYDELNLPGKAHVANLLTMLREIEKHGESAEITYHLGQHTIAADQAGILRHPSVLEALGRFRFEYPHEMWQRVEYQSK